MVQSLSDAINAWNRLAARRPDDMPDGSAASVRKIGAAILVLVHDLPVAQLVRRGQIGKRFPDTELVEIGVHTLVDDIIRMMVEYKTPALPLKWAYCGHGLCSPSGQRVSDTTFSNTIDDALDRGLLGMISGDDPRLMSCRIAAKRSSAKVLVFLDKNWEQYLSGNAWSQFLEASLLESLVPKK